MKTIFIAGAVVGAAASSVVSLGVGYALGNLFASKSGKELRDDIADKANEFAGGVKDKFAATTSSEDDI
ncbi:MAG: YtxH domain-containing protein [Candidatus Obscuribacterales bacterium]